MSLKKNAIKGLKWTTIGTIGRSVFQLLQISILARYLPKEAFGLVAMALFVIQFSTIFVDMGMTSAILHRQNATKKEYSSIYWLNIFIAVFLYGLLYLIAPFAATFYEETELVILIPILGLNLLLLATGRQHRTIMQKEFNFSAIAKIELLSYFIGLISAVLFAINGFDLYSLVYSTLIASFISNALFLYLNLKKNPISLYFKLKDTKPFLKIGGYTMGSSLLDFFSREIDVLIIGKMLGSESLGLYSIAKQLVLKIYAIINPIILTVLSPILSSIQNDKERMKYYYLKVVRLLATVNFPIYLAVIVLSKEILTILYGTEYEVGYLVLSFLAVSYAANSISNPVGSLQIATGRTDLGLKWTIFRLLVTPLIIFISAQFSVNAVAFALAILSIFLTFPLWYIQIKPMVHITLNEYLAQYIKPFLLLLFIASGFILINEFQFLPFGLIINSIIKLLLAILIYTLLLWFIDRQRVNEIISLINSQLKKSNAS